MSTDRSASPKTGRPPLVRIIYRSGPGLVDLECSPDRLAEVLADPKGAVWVDIEDPDSQTAEIEAMFRDVFHFHPLAIEDALQDSNVPKVDDWSDYLYLAFHSIDFDPETDHLRLHELDLFLGANYLVSYHNEPIAVLEELRRNLHRDNGDRIKHGADHLLYQILDLGVDEFLTAIEHLDEAIDEAQDEVFRDSTPATLQKIFQVKRAALQIHRIISPQREVLNRLARDEYPQIGPRDRVYFRDVYDHLVRLHDISETLRDLISGALDTYLSAISNRTNDVMKTLTIVTVMALPLNLLVGFFGMNFFADTLAFTRPPLPNALLFAATCLTMVTAPILIWIWAKRRNWF
ncbi:MAG: magnesium/cobalt transporter CorA [Isosphaeraceae bacterium]